MTSKQAWPPRNPWTMYKDLINTAERLRRSGIGEEAQ